MDCLDGSVSVADTRCTSILEVVVFLIALAIVLAVTSAIVVARAYRAAKEDLVEALYKE